jgi:hypothetical protein
VPHQQKKDGTGDYPSQSDQFLVGTGWGDLIKIPRLLRPQHIRPPWSGSMRNWALFRHTVKPVVFLLDFPQANLGVNIPVSKDKASSGR